MVCRLLFGWRGLVSATCALERIALNRLPIDWSAPLANASSASPARGGWSRSVPLRLERAVSWVALHGCCHILANAGSADVAWTLGGSGSPDGAGAAYLSGRALRRRAGTVCCAYVGSHQKKHIVLHRSPTESAGTQELPEIFLEVTKW